MATLWASEQQASINPYNTVPSLASAFVAAYSNGLNAMVTTLVGGSGPTIQNLNTALTSYIEPLYYPVTPTPDQLYKLNAILGSTYNAYIQPGRAYRAFYTPAQLALIEQIMDMINEMPISPSGGPIFVSATNLFFALEEAIEDSDIPAQEQAPLFMATAIAYAAYTYFFPICQFPTVGTWSLLLDSNPYLNYMNFRNWINAAVAGALIGNTQSKPLVTTSAADAAGVGDCFYTTVAGALACTFGVSVFQWARKPMPIIGG